MIFNKHSNLKDQHAFLSASKYHWINYTEEKLDESYFNWMAVQRGTRLHAFASEAIALGIKLYRSKKTLNMFVNDAIGFRMATEQVLYYSDNCFGTADAISFRDKFLRIHDLKTGQTPTSMAQLRVYAALFCLEYQVDPKEIEIELRIYQNDSVKIEDPDRKEILRIMGVIVAFDKRINMLKGE